MPASRITIPVRIDAATFRRFSLFDTFALGKRWVRPAVFALILGGFAAVALCSGKPQSGLIAGVLLLVGLGLPLIYFGAYFAQVRQQIRRFDLATPRRMYTVTLDFDGIRVTNDQKKEDAQFVPWENARAAYRRRGCVYLYAAANKAYLLPDGQSDAGDEATWQYIRAHMGERANLS